MADIINIQDSARRQQLLPCSATGTTNARCDLTPATLRLGKAELGACLTLVSPSGLTADDRREWIAIAMKTLSGIPADLLEAGCAEARLRCRFPSEIVPTIVAAVETEWNWRIKDARRGPMPKHVALPAPPVDTSPLVIAAAVRALIKSLGNA